MPVGARAVAPVKVCPVCACRASDPAARDTGRASRVMGRLVGDDVRIRRTVFPLLRETVPPVCDPAPVIGDSVPPVRDGCRVRLECDRIVRGTGRLVRKSVPVVRDPGRTVRASLLEKKPKMVFNQIGRAYGVLANSHIIASKEAMNMLSFVRLGVDLGMFPGAERHLTDELFIQTQPAHLQRLHSEKLAAEERDLLRADMIRERLKTMSRPITPPPPPPAQPQ